MKKEPKLTSHMATAQGMTTLVGFYGPFPRKRGNCFSVYVGKIETKEDYQRAQSFRIINFNAENLDHLLENGTITWPIEIAQLDDTYLAKIVDKRIPENFFDSQPCRICTSRKYWTSEQRKQRADDIRSGELVISKKHKMEDGTEFRVERRRIKPRNMKPLKLTIDKEASETLELDKEGYFLSPYLPVMREPKTNLAVKVAEFIVKNYKHRSYKTFSEKLFDSLWFRLAYLVTALAAFTFAWYKAVESLLKPH